MGHLNLLCSESLRCRLCGVDNRLCDTALGSGMLQETQGSFTESSRGF